MGWRFRKSIKILPGIRLNFNKNSTSVSIGSKSAGITVNSKTGVTARTSIPGTGLSYSEKISKPKKNTAPAKKSSIPLNERVKQMYVQQAQNDLRIIKESAFIVERTLDPSVFFSRMDLMFERLEHLVSIEHHLSLTGESPSVVYQKTKDSYSENVKEFIEKYFDDSFSKATGLKTRAGKENRIKKSFETLMQHKDTMDADCVSLAERLRDDYLQKV